MTYQDALDILLKLTPADYVLENYETPDYFEFRVSCGGDICTYRINKKTGRIGEK